jgi:transcriptional regulator with XRE-family HTH domain
MEQRTPETLQEIRDALTDRKLSVVAERIGMTYAALNRVQRGGQPSKRTVEKLREYLKK